MRNQNNSITKNILVILVVLICVSGLYTFYNAKGLSYLSNDPQACNNCHIMNDVYNDYLASSHSLKIAGKERATCVDCHLPHDFVGKWMAKAKSGIAHGYAFTMELENLPVNLSANAESKKNVQSNCIYCHSEVAENVINPTLSHKDIGNVLSCVSCHDSVGHKRGF